MCGRCCSSLHSPELTVFCMGGLHWHLAVLFVFQQQCQYKFLKDAFKRNTVFSKQSSRLHQPFFKKLSSPRTWVRSLYLEFSLQIVSLFQWMFLKKSLLFPPPDRSVYFQFPILNLWLLKWDLQLVEDRNLEFTSDFSVFQNIFLERGNLSHSCCMALQFAPLVASCSFRSMCLFRKFWHSFEVKEMFLEDILQSTRCTNKEMVN